MKNVYEYKNMLIHFYFIFFNFLNFLWNAPGWSISLYYNNGKDIFWAFLQSKEGHKHECVKKFVQCIKKLKHCYLNNGNIAWASVTKRKLKEFASTQKQALLIDMVIYRFSTFGFIVSLYKICKNRNITVF